ncbi:MAG: DUF423 domain-containing protein [Flavobacteriales bacterium]|nr:DUF423 domain-containing protein [Flavobacteriales bacterium]
MNKTSISALVLAIAVISGAFGAHMLKNLLTEDHLKSWHTAVEYQFYHGLGLLFLSMVPETFVKQQRLLNLSWKFLLTGVILFSGSIYLLSTTEITSLNLRWLGPVTPIGGLFFIAGWLTLAFSLGKKQ